MADYLLVRPRGTHRASLALLARALLASLVLCACCGCGAGSQGGARDPGEQVDVEALRSLPYTGYSKESADAGAMGVVLYDQDHAYPGYNLYSNRDLCSAELLDMHGNVLRSWETREPCHHWSNIELSPQGDLFTAGMDAIPGEDDELRQYVGLRYLLRLSWDGKVVWKLRIPAHHDVELTPTGQLLTLTMSYRRIPAVDPVVDVRDNSITLLDLDGRIVNEVSLYDLLGAADSGFHLQKAGLKGKHGDKEYDLFHANSVESMRYRNLEERDPLYAPGNVLLSMRHQDALVVIDLQRRRLVWSWGQGEISGPHDATVLENGNFLLLDNGLARGWSRVIELDPLRKKIVWEYRAKNQKEFFTASRGSDQRLPNGNTLLTNSDHGEAFEVTPSGEMVWRFLNPHLDSDGHRSSIVRLRRYERGAIEAIERVRQSGGE